MNTALLILGGGQCLTSDVAFFQHVCKTPYDVAAVNDAGIIWPNDLSFWATLHPEKMAFWAMQRQRNGFKKPEIVSTHQQEGINRIVLERWHGASGLYAVQIALFAKGYSKVILAGVPMDEGGHYFAPQEIGGREWANGCVYRYRQGFLKALPEIKDNVRSMSGWTKQQLSAPTTDWLNG